MPEICLCFNCMKQYKKEYGMCPFCGYQNEQSRTEPIHLLPGTMLQGKYFVGKSIGHGGFSVTYVGLDTVLDVRVAIKEYMPSEYATRSGNSLSLTISQQGDAPQRYREGVKKFVEEARRLASMDNVQGIVKVFDAFVENNTAYIVMEYLEGETLSEKLRKEGPMEPEKAFMLLLPLMDSLERVHRAGILHRDISPDNVICTNDGTIKLIDFGSARHISKEKSMSVFIKPGYTPAEQYSSNGEQGTWTDVYALAATIYKMITGVTPPDGLQRKIKDKLQPVSKQGIRISRNAENALLNAMNVSVEKRTKTVEAFKNQLYSTKEVKRVAESGGSGSKAVKLTAIVVSSVVVVLAATIGILIASGVFGRDVTYTNGAYSLSAGETLVPRFISSTIDEAEKKAQQFDLILQANEADFSTDVPMDKILAQDPDAGVRVSKGTKVNVSLSAGPKMYLMPKVRGLSQEDAEKKLKENGFDIAARTAESVYVKGSVCAEDKVSGEVYQENTKVILTISEGRTVDKTQKSAVPDFVGSTVDHAEEAAEKGGVSLRIAYRSAAGKRDGEIIEQSVKPNEQIDRYDVVTIVIADNSKVLVPYVKGKVMVDANNAITKAGLKPVVAARVYSDTVAAGHVIDQTPGGQTAAERGTEVALTISLGAQSEGGESVEVPAESGVSESTQTEETHQPSTEETASSRAAESSAGASSKASSKVSDASQRSGAASSAVSRVTSEQSVVSSILRISGTVTNHSGQALGGAIVSVVDSAGKKYSVTSDSNGSYSVKVNKTGDNQFTITFDADGYLQFVWNGTANGYDAYMINATLESAVQPQQSDESVSATDWRTLYKSFLKEKAKIQEKDYSYHFNLYDISGDGIPELFWAKKFKDYYGFQGGEVYTIVNNQVVDCGIEKDMTAHNEGYCNPPGQIEICPSEHVVISYNVSAGDYYFINYHRITSSGAQLIASVGRMWGYPDYTNYYNETTVSQEKLEQISQELKTQYAGDSAFASGDYIISNVNIDSVIDNWH